MKGGFCSRPPAPRAADLVGRQSCPPRLTRAQTSLPPTLCPALSQGGRVVCNAKIRAEGPGSESLASPPKGPPGVRACRPLAWAGATPRREAIPRSMALSYPLWGRQLGRANWGAGRGAALARLRGAGADLSGHGTRVSEVALGAQLKFLAIGLFLPHSVPQARVPLALLSTFRVR